jgi:pentatricopeptide repeat protein
MNQAQGPNLKDSFNTEKMLEKSLVICDDTTWIWHFINTTLRSREIDHLRLNSSFSFKTNWQRFKSCKHIILVWENRFRPHGSIIEEIKGIEPTRDIGEQVIVITTSPGRQDVIYFHELGIYKIVKLENDKTRIEQARKELTSYMENHQVKNTQIMGKLHRLLDLIMQKPTKDLIDIAIKLHKAMTGKPGNKLKAPIYDIDATLAYARKDLPLAISYWEKALDLNPNYFRAVNSLIHVYREMNEPNKAIMLMKKMHQNNNRHVGRLTCMGQTYLDVKNNYLAEGFFSRAIEKDKFSDPAKTGLAEVKFLQGDLVTAKRLLQDVHSSDTIAKSLNRRGIDLVHSEHYKEALKHYIQAHYILPDQNKSSLIFYNIGLCYSRWGEFALAEQYLKLALIKNPDYAKAKSLLARVQRFEKDPNAKSPAKTNR